MISRLSHIAVAVASLEETARFYEQQLGLKLEGTETVPQQKVKVGFIPVGETCLELLEPVSPDSPIAKFLEKRGPGLQHICLEVDDAEAEFKRLAAAGVQLIDEAPKAGAHGTKVFFIHPRSTGGVLIEVSQPPVSDVQPFHD